MTNRELREEGYRPKLIQEYLDFHHAHIKRKSVEAGEYTNRILDVLCSPYNIFIDRVQGAGIRSEETIKMHNGLDIHIDSYYPDLVAPMLEVNKGVHEPEEEAYFSKVLPLINNAKPIMVELGSYWAFYSMWFLSCHTSGKALMVEPDKERLLSGQKNFELNGLEGEWINETVGPNEFVIDKFIRDRQITQLDVLHSDIQGAEYDMLLGAQESLRRRMIDFLFVSTHSNVLHDQCHSVIVDYGYHVLFQSNMDTSSCYDGIIVASKDKNNINF